MCVMKVFNLFIHSEIGVGVIYAQNIFFYYKLKFIISILL